MNDEERKGEGERNEAVAGAASSFSCYATYLRDFPVPTAQLSAAAAAGTQGRLSTWVLRGEEGGTGALMSEEGLHPGLERQRGMRAPLL